MRTCITREQLFDNQTHSTEMLDQLVTEFDVEREKLKEFIIKNNSNTFHHISYF